MLVMDKYTAADILREVGRFMLQEPSCFKVEEQYRNLKSSIVD
jgi:hypothetical protein